MSAGATSVQLQKKRGKGDGNGNGQRFFTDDDGTIHPITGEGGAIYEEPALQAYQQLHPNHKIYNIGDNLNVFEEMRATAEELTVLHILGTEENLNLVQISEKTGIPPDKVQKAIDNLLVNKKIIVGKANNNGGHLGS